MSDENYRANTFSINDIRSGANVFHEDIMQTQSELKDCKSCLKRLGDDRYNLECELEDLQAKVDCKKDDIECLQEKIALEENKVAENCSVIEYYSHDEQLDECESIIADYELDLESADDALQSLALQVHQLESKLHTCDDIIKSVEEEASDLKSELSYYKDGYKALDGYLKSVSS